MNCINCRTENSGKGDCIEVFHQGVEIGQVCNECMQGVNGLRLFVKREKDGTFELKEMQVIPNPR
jgi:hypothetical protein